MFSWFLTYWHSFVQAIARLVTRLIAPVSQNKDSARREGILNILLLSCIGMISLATLLAFYNEITGLSAKGTTIEVLIIWLFFGLAYYFSRRGQARVVSHVILWLLFIVTTLGMYRWGADLPQALLTYALIVVMAGILVDSRFSFVLTILGGVSLVSITLIQLLTRASAVPSWRYSSLTLGDSVVSAITLAVMAIVSWLFNREMERSLKRARLSELALKRQRDQLEITVEARTAELKQIQADKIIQLYRLAEFGKATSGLFHDLVNPLTLVSLNLNALTRQMKKTELTHAQAALTRALNGTKRLEQFVKTVKRQIREQTVRKKFSLNAEIRDAMQVLHHKAKKNQVSFRFISAGAMSTVGDPMKFNQLVTNLVANAIDAYEGKEEAKKIVEIQVKKVAKNIFLEVKDWGVGIEPQNLDKIFEPLFTTKAADKGTGIGLSICRDIIVKDFQGTYVVKTEVGVGTTFKIKFPLVMLPPKKSQPVEVQT